MPKRKLSIYDLHLDHEWEAFNIGDEKFRLSGTGAEYLEALNSLEDSLISKFEDEFDNVPTHDQLEFTKFYLEKELRTLYWKYNNYPFKERHPKDLPVLKLLDHVTFKAQEFLVEHLEWRISKLYSSASVVNIEKPDKKSKLDSIGRTQSRTITNIKFDSLFVDIRLKPNLFSLLRYHGVLDEKNNWIKGLNDEKDARALYEALVEMKFMIKQKNKATVFRAFQEELNFDISQKHFGALPSDEAIEIYVENLKYLRKL